MANNSKSKNRPVLSPRRRDGTSDDLVNLLDGVVGAVEATRYEHHMLWQEYANEALMLREGGPDNRLRYSWKQGLSGLISTIGHFDNRPVCLSLLVDTVACHRILFWHATSQVVDHVLIDDWMDAVLPYRINGDPMNFCNLLGALPQKTTVWLH